MESRVLRELEGVGRRLWRVPICFVGRWEEDLVLVRTRLEEDREWDLGLLCLALFRGRWDRPAEGSVSEEEVE